MTDRHTPDRGTVFAATFAALFAAHQLGDYWVQTDHQAITKGEAGAAGRRACAAHVATYTATTGAAVAGASRVLRLRVGWRGWLAGQVVSAVTHYAADRREHGALFRAADALGKGTFARERGGAPLLDQAWHIGALGLSALATAVLSRRRTAAPEGK
jgi:hypothetical protein